MASAHVVAMQASPPGPTGLSSRSLHCCVEQRMGFAKGRVVGGLVECPAGLAGVTSQPENQCPAVPRKFVLWG